MSDASYLLPFLRDCLIVFGFLAWIALYVAAACASFGLILSLAWRDLQSRLRP
jgi:hypothetical protein